MSDTYALYTAKIAENAENNFNNSIQFFLKLIKYGLIGQNAMSIVKNYRKKALQAHDLCKEYKD